MLCRASWACINDILLRFQKATGLFINKEKSFLYHNDVGLDIVQWISDLMGITPQLLHQGFKYLGFSLKAKGYTTRDWQWLLERIFKKIAPWEYKFLSLVGRLILAQSILCQLSVYWTHIFYLPSKIIKQMNKLIANFLWGGQAY